MSVTRRECLTGAAGGMLLTLLPRAAQAGERALLQAMYGEARVVFDRVELDLPPLVENGNSVALTVSVDSPMTEADHIAAIDVLAGDNPMPHLVHFGLTPGSGRATIATRIRLAGSQPVLAVARTSRGQLFGASAEILVTEAACLDFLI